MLLTRNQFREKVFDRDNHKCVVCQKQAKDAHHILERRLWNDGGYYLDNGVSLCEEHHLKAESTEISCETLRELAGIQKVILPEHLYPDFIYDKWGNPFLENGNLRYKGELYHDESVKKILDWRWNNSTIFTDKIKYPRTYHLPWSPGGTNDDRRMSDSIANELIQNDIVVTPKLDGENTTMYRNDIHARSLDSQHSKDRDWVKNLWSKIRFNIPEDWRICGENLFAKHSLYYTNLPSYFMVFSIWNEKNECLSWKETKEWTQLLELNLVPTWLEGKWNSDLINEKLTQKSELLPEEGEHEGYVIRSSESFHMKDFRTKVGKYVRKNHVVEHGRHWRRRKIEQNLLK